jgi:hypothetical protein
MFRKYCKRDLLGGVAAWAVVVAQFAALVGSYCWCPLFSEHGCVCCTTAGGIVSSESREVAGCCFLAAASPSCCGESFPDEGAYSLGRLTGKTGGDSGGLAGRRCCSGSCPCQVRAGRIEPAVPAVASLWLLDHVAGWPAFVAAEALAAPRTFGGELGGAEGRRLFGPALLGMLCRWLK